MVPYRVPFTPDPRFYAWKRGQEASPFRKYIVPKEGALEPQQLEQRAA